MERPRKSFWRSQMVAMIVVFCDLSRLVDGYCWQPGWNPEFVSQPTVTQVDSTSVIVSWNNVVKNTECVDQFVVKFWPEAQPDNFRMTSFLDPDVKAVQLTNIPPRVPYVFQVIAREDKGKILGVDYNRSENVKLKLRLMEGQGGPNTSDSAGLDKAKGTNSGGSAGSASRSEIAAVPKVDIQRPGSMREEEVQQVTLQDPKDDSPEAQEERLASSGGGTGGHNGTSSSDKLLFYTIAIVGGIMFVVILVGVTAKYASIFLKRSRRAPADGEDPDKNAGQSLTTENAKEAGT